MEALLFIFWTVVYVGGAIITWFLSAWMNDDGRYDKVGFMAVIFSWLGLLILGIMIAIKSIEDMPNPTLKKK